MKLLSYQPFPIYENGGGSRILRRLYLGHETSVTSLVVTEIQTTPIKGEIEEVNILAVPITKRWMRSYLRNIASWMRNVIFRPLTVKKIKKAVRVHNFDIIHVVNHGAFSSAICDEKILLGKNLWVSFHDHFSTAGSSFKDTNLLWNRADRRLVISDEMGVEYQNLFGNRVYEVVTDGLKVDEVSVPADKKGGTYIVYFAGLLHIDYLPLFRVLANALEFLSKQGIPMKLVLRGTQKIDFLNDRGFEVEYRPVTLNDITLKQELNEALVLYLPIKFSNPNFYLYSLSTKMIGYLGGAGSILYHGPGDSAACNFLKKAKAAVCCESLNTYELVTNIKILIDGKSEVSKNAKLVANSKFKLDSIQTKFWMEVDKY